MAIGGAGKKGITISILGDASDFQGALGKVEKSVGGVTDKLKGFGDFAMKAFASAQTLGAFSKSVDAASNLNETINKTGEVFGTAADEVVKWSETTASSIGQSQQAALNGAATFGVFADAAGLADGEAAEFSITMSELASDLSSFHNTSPERAVYAIGAAMRGESEPIRAYGILLDQNTMKQRALEEGLISTSKEFDQQTRVIMTQKMILEQSALAQGDFARTSDDLANSKRILSAQIEDLTAKTGQMLLPVVTQTTKALSSMVTVVSEMDPALRETITAMGGMTLVTGPLIGRMGGLKTVFEETRYQAHLLKMAVGQEGLASVLTGMINPAVVLSTVAVAAAAYAFYDWRKTAAETKAEMETLAPVVDAVADSFRDLELVTESGAVSDKALKILNQTTLSLEEMNDSALALDESLGKSSGVSGFVRALNAAADGGDAFAQSLRTSWETGEINIDQTMELGRSYAKLGEDYRKMAADRKEEVEGSIEALEASKAITESQANEARARFENVVSLAEYNDALNLLREESPELAGALGLVEVATDGVGGSMDEAAPAAQTLADILGEYADALDRIIGTAKSDVALRKDQITGFEGLAEATQAWKDEKTPEHYLDIQTAGLDVLDTMQDIYQSAVDAGTVDPSTMSFSNWLRDTLPRDSLNALLQVAEVQGALSDIAATEATANLKIDGVTRALSELESVLAKMREISGGYLSPTLSANPTYGSSGGGGTTLDYRGIPVVQRAYGGPLGESGFVDVGERGRERVWLPKGSEVQPNHELGAGNSITVSVASNAHPDDIARALAWQLEMI